MITYIMTDLRNAWNAFSVYNVYITLAITIVFVLVQCILFAFNRGIFAGKNAILKMLLFFAGTVYISFVVDLTLLNREAGSRCGVSLHLFETFYPDPESMRYVYENILLLLPMGIWLPMMFSAFRRGITVAGTAFFTSCMIEVVQHITKRGYFQVDDIWLNTAGAIGGYIIYRFIKMLAQKGIIYYENKQQ